MHGKNNTNLLHNRIEDYWPLEIIRDLPENCCSMMAGISLQYTQSVSLFSTQQLSHRHQEESQTRRFSSSSDVALMSMFS